MACLFIEPVDFTRPLFGSGREAAAASAIRVFGDNLLLVGASSGDGRMGVWTEVTVEGRTCRFLPVITSKALWGTRVPANVRFAGALLRWSTALAKPGVASVFTGTYTVLWRLAFAPTRRDLCFCYPGLGNPMLVGRRPRLGKRLAGIYEAVQAKALQKVSVAFAAASSSVVEEYNAALRRRGCTVEVRSLPSAVDTEFFCPGSREEARDGMSLPRQGRVYTFVGRLAAVKGIPFLFEALQRVLAVRPEAHLLLVGNGEERRGLERLALSMRLTPRVRFLGALPPAGVRAAILAADACVVGSWTEGFSFAMIEQLACGRPIVSTDVSGARDLIQEGVNGFVVRNRDAAEFAAAMLAAGDLPRAGSVSRQVAVDRYSEVHLWQAVARAWPAVGCA